jgi:hypothetical protein
MSYSVGDGIVVTALTAGAVGYFYLKAQERRRRLEIIHAERVEAMDKGIPLPELPMEAPTTSRGADPHTPLIMGIVLAAFGFGTMIAMSMVEEFHRAWPMPLPVALMGLGLVLYYVLTGGDRASAARRGN